MLEKVIRERLSIDRPFRATYLADWGAHKGDSVEAMLEFALTLPSWMDYPYLDRDILALMGKDHLKMEHAKIASVKRYWETLARVLRHVYTYFPEAGGINITPEKFTRVKDFVVLDAKELNPNYYVALRMARAFEGRPFEGRIAFRPAEGVELLSYALSEHANNFYD